jgi:hypothetical protein
MQKIWMLNDALISAKCGLPCARKFRFPNAKVLPPKLVGLLFFAKTLTACQ